MKEISCSFCGKNEALLLYKLKDKMLRVEDPSKFNLCLCQNCGLVYLNPQPEWRELEYFYGSNYYTNVGRASQKLSLGRTLYQLIRKMKRVIIGPPHPKFWNFGQRQGKFLDVGCGNGAYDAYVIKDYPLWKFYGVEPSRESASLAKEIPGLKVFNGFLEDAGYETDFFDVILMSHSLEHTSDPLAAVKESHRILKPSGRLVIKIPNFSSLSRVLFGKYWYHLDAPRHLFHFTPPVILGILKKKGFEVESLRYEALGGSVLRSIAYYFGKKQFFFESRFVLTLIHYLILPLKKVAEWMEIASGLEIIAVKK